ncbi:MAG: TetR family transcriptional regulator [Rhizobiales bacterium]|nr:TetR family transcriptional regulator [Hyphomicrobiales bacterium]
MNLKKSGASAAGASPRKKSARKVERVISSTRKKRASNGTRDPERTRRNLLDAAYREFSANGYHGASIEKICNRAGVSKQILSHHFGAKADVYLMVLERAYEASRAHDPELDLEGVDPVEAIRRFIGFGFDHLRDDRAFVSLLADENINRGRNIRRSTKLRDLYAPLIERLGAVLRRGEASGAFRPGVDPRQFYISVSALCFFSFSNAYTLAAVLGGDLLTKDAVEARRAHVLDFALSAIRA